MRTLRWFCGLALLIPCAIGTAQDAAWKEVKTAHYVVRTNATAKHAQDAAAFLEAFYGTYASLVGSAESGAIGRLKLFRDYRDFQKEISTPGAVMHYDPAAREIVSWVGDPEGTLQRLLIEAGRQFQHLWFGASYPGGLPPWLNQGMSLCMNNGEMRKKRYYAAVPYGSQPRSAIPAVAKMIKEGGVPRLEDFLLMDEGRFNSTGNSTAIAWSICHFLLCYPELGQGEQEKPLPQGKYAHVLTRLYQGLKKGGASKGLKDLYRQAFVTKDNRPIDLAGLEKEWQQYVVDFEPYFANLDKEAADKLQKAVDLARERKWTEVRELLDKFATLYRNTPTYEWKRAELTQVADLARRAAEGKDAFVEIVLFGGKDKDIEQMSVVDIRQNTKAWRVDNKLLVGESEWANLCYFSTTLLDWSLTVVFKCDKDSKAEALFGISGQNKTSDTTESWDRGAWFHPATGEVESFDGSTRHPATMAKVTPAPSKNEWNTLTLSREGSKVLIHFNQEKLFEYGLEKHDSLAGHWSLSVRKGRAWVKSAVLRLN